MAHHCGNVEPLLVKLILQYFMVFCSFVCFCCCFLFSIFLFFYIFYSFLFAALLGGTIGIHGGRLVEKCSGGG